MMSTNNKDKERNRNNKAIITINRIPTLQIHQTAIIININNRKSRSNRNSILILIPLMKNIALKTLKS